MRIVRQMIDVLRDRFRMGGVEALFFLAVAAGCSNYEPKGTSGAAGTPQSASPTASSSSAPSAVPPERSPAPSGAAATAGAAAAPEADAAAGPTPEVLTTVASDANVLLAPSPAAFAAIGGEVFDLAKRAKAGSLAAVPKAVTGPRALSPDGRFFALQQSGADYVMFVEIQECQTGRKLHEFLYSKDKFQRVELLRFTKHNRLVVAAPAKGKMGVFVINPADGTALKELLIERADANHLGVSDDGRLLAVATTQELSIYDVAKGQVVARIAEPPTQPKLNSLIFSRGFTFSPDNTEVAGLFALNGFRLVVWDLDGKIKEDHALGLRIGGAYNEGDPVEWSPDGQGWLLHGNHYFDRRLKSIAWAMIPPPGHNYHHRWLDKDHVVATQGDFKNRRLVSVRVPRDGIDAATKSLESGQAAWLRPGHSITLDVQVGQTRFSDSGSVKSALEELLTKRFAEGGIKVAPAQTTVLHVKYSEKGGEQLRVVEGFGPTSRDTGQRVQETVALLEASMVASGAPKPIWETTVRLSPRIVNSATVNDAEVRKAAYNGLEYRLASTPIPFFVPADPNVPRLPLLTSL